LKILHFLTSINTGGAEKFCVDLCNTQANISDHRIYLCVLDKLENQPLLNSISNNVTLISLNKEGGYNLKIIYKIYKLLSKIEPDTIHLNGRALIYTSLAILFKQIPSIYTVHTMADKEYNKYIKKYIKLLFNNFSSLFVPVSISQSVSRTVQIVYGNSFNKIIYNGSSELNVSPNIELVTNEINILKKDKDTLVFVSVGRIAPEKNTLLLVKSFNRLLDDGKNVCLCIVGYDTTKEQVYMTMCENTNKYHDRIKFVGQKDNVSDYLESADASCLTSNYEGLGIAALEAFSMGIPVLSTPSGGPSDIIISGINGYVSKYISVESYVDILMDFIAIPLNDRKRIFKIYKERYTMDICAHEYLELYKTKLKKEFKCI